jgi:hypothetical protein
MAEKAIETAGLAKGFLQEQINTALCIDRQVVAVGWQPLQVRTPAETGERYAPHEKTLLSRAEKTSVCHTRATGLHFWHFSLDWRIENMEVIDSSWC